ncbi:MAG: hypothetical protein ABI127_05490 [Dokdonella sp.]
MKFVPAIAFDYRPCRGIALAIAGMTVLSMAAVAASGLPVFLKVLIGLAALGLGLMALQRLWRPGIVRIARGQAGWLLVDGEGNEAAVALVDHAHRGFLLMLGFRKGDGPIRRVLLTPDNCDADLRRRLLLTIAASKDPASPKTAN